MITQKVIEEVGADALYKGGLKIYTTLDPDMQKAAENAMKHLPGYYTDGKKLTQPQMALVAVDPHNGYVKAMIGGRGRISSTVLLLQYVSPVLPSSLLSI